MQFIFDGITVVLMSYLAFTNFLATSISTILAPNETAEVTVGTTSPTPLPSVYTTRSIPDVLLRSAEYQRAAVIESELPTRLTTTDPLSALVNVYCTFITPRNIRTTTGTGFFIEQSGVILTNAHVAQFLLLEKTDVLGETSCIIRNGNPASARYTAELLYISPAWVQANASLVDATAPVGTGERDYALLYVTGTVDESPLPSIFPALDVNTSVVPRDTTESTVTAAAYPAGALFTQGTTVGLLPKLATTTVSQLYTFTSNQADVFGLRGSAVGEQGSSGGPVLARDTRVIGMITTRGNDERDGAGSLRAITLSHIDRTITEETGVSLRANISGDVPYRAQVFADTMAPFLTNLLAREIE
jgi:S1-C subfamily serine protease